MISKKDITKLAKRILRRQKGLRDHQMIHPRREWATGFIAGTLLLVGGAVWSFFTYGEVSEREVDTVDAGAIQQTIYRGQLVESALEEFRSKRASYQALLEDRETATAPPTEPVTEEEAAPVPVETEAETVPTDTDAEPAESDEEAISEQPSGPPEVPPDLESGA